jgi:histidinol-phosphate aminotransferase
MLGNGSSEVFDNIFRCLLEPGDEVIQHTPCFGIYKLRCNILGGKLVSVPMKYENKQVLFDADAIIAAVTPKTKMIVVANPNNPTGNFMDKADFVRIAELGVPFISDEAYIEYAGLEKSNVDLTKKFPNLLVTRTMSKAYGLAGLRFGYALGAKEVIAQISGAMLPWNVGTIPMWAGLAGFEDQEALKERVDFNNAQVRCYEEALADVKGLEIYHSYANYILFDGTDAGKTGKGMLDFALEKRGLIFRAQTPMYGRDGWFRITIGTADENQMAIQAIRDYFAQ